MTGGNRESRNAGDTSDYRPAYRGDASDDDVVMEAVGMAGPFLHRVVWTPRGSEAAEEFTVPEGLDPFALAGRCRSAGHLQGLDAASRSVLDITRGGDGLVATLHLDDEQRWAIEARLGGIPGDPVLIPVEDWCADRESRGGNLLPAVMALALATADIDDTGATLHPAAWSFSSVWAIVWFCVMLALFPLCGLQIVRVVRRKLARRWVRWKADRRTAATSARGV